MLGQTRIGGNAPGARRVGMRTVLYAPDGAAPGAADVVVRSFAELASLAGVR